MGVERSSRYLSRSLQNALNRRSERVRVSKHAPRNRCRAFERRHGLAKIVECGAAVIAERHRIIPLHPKRDYFTFSENASRDGHRFAQQLLGFFAAR